MYGEAEIEASEAALAQQAELAISRIRGGLDGPGSAECQTCGELIPAARRAALPSAVRCVDCQSKVEGTR